MERKHEIAAVVIPVYRSELSENEIHALRQGVKILSGYKLCLVAPVSLNIENYLEYYADFEVFRFADSYFKNIRGYNQLLLSPVFYHTFKFTDFILIYQLDAFVFRDELRNWCHKNYTYIGAPWVIQPPKLKEKPMVDLGKYLKHRVGNGGFSLRKVKSHFWTSLLFWPLTRLFTKNEDFFWSIIAPKLNPFFRIPRMQEALAFAFELAPRKAFQMNQEKLPFGCHAWEKYEPDFWVPFIHPPKQKE